MSLKYILYKGGFGPGLGLGEVHKGSKFSFCSASASASSSRWPRPCGNSFSLSKLKSFASPFPLYLRFIRNSFPLASSSSLSSPFLTFSLSESWSLPFAQAQENPNELNTKQKTKALPKSHTQKLVLGGCGKGLIRLRYWGSSLNRATSTKFFHHQNRNHYKYNHHQNHHRHFSNSPFQHFSFFRRLTSYEGLVAYFIVGGLSFAFASYYKHFRVPVHNNQLVEDTKIIFMESPSFETLIYQLFLSNSNQDKKNETDPNHTESNGLNKLSVSKALSFTLENGPYYSGGESKLYQSNMAFCLFAKPQIEAPNNLNELPKHIQVDVQLRAHKNPDQKNDNDETQNNNPNRNISKSGWIMDEILVFLPANQTYYLFDFLSNQLNPTTQSPPKLTLKRVISQNPFLSNEEIMERVNKEVRAEVFADSPEGVSSDPKNVIQSKWNEVKPKLFYRTPEGSPRLGEYGRILSSVLVLGSVCLFTFLHFRRIRRRQIFDLLEPSIKSNPSLNKHLGSPLKVSSKCKASISPINLSFITAVQGSNHRAIVKLQGQPIQTIKSLNNDETMTESSKMEFSGIHKSKLFDMNLWKFTHASFTITPSGLKQTSSEPTERFFRFITPSDESTKNTNSKLAKGTGVGSNPQVEKSNEN